MRTEGIRGVLRPPFLYKPTSRQEEFGSGARRSRGSVSVGRSSTERATTLRSQRTLALWVAPLLASGFVARQSRSGSYAPSSRRARGSKVAQRNVGLYMNRGLRGGHSS